MWFINLLLSNLIGQNITTMVEDTANTWPDGNSCRHHTCSAIATVYRYKPVNKCILYGIITHSYVTKHIQPSSFTLMLYVVSNYLLLIVSLGWCLIILLCCPIIIRSVWLMMILVVTHTSDINECLSNPCHPNATCKNTNGTFTCECDAEYEGDGFTCQGIIFL